MRTRKRCVGDVLEILRKVGLHSGVIHAEAKVMNSTSEAPSEGIGLRPRTAEVNGERSTFLLEINPRPGGLPEPMCSKYAYGIDYFAAQLLHAIGDEARFRSIAHGLQSKPIRQNAWLPQAVSTTEHGKMPHDYGLRELDLADSYVDHWHYWKAGEEVPAVEKRPWPGLGFMVFQSLSSRRELLRKVALAKKHLHFRLV